MLHDIRRVSSAKGSMLLLRRSGFNEPQAFFDHFFRRCLETVAIISVKLFSRQNGFYRVRKSVLRIDLSFTAPLGIIERQSVLR